MRTDLKEYIRLHEGKQVLISTTTGQVGGVLAGNIPDEGGNVIALLVKQYLHRVEVPAEDILSIRLV